ncbi:MAG: GTP-binding protein [Xanthomonadales bacterium]|jgi:small GTP-binding protein|nr:GTP-binding protein [Xanthomonadales bacterium]
MPWKTMRDVLRGWRSGKPGTSTLPEDHLLQANRNLRELLTDDSIPASIRQALEPEFREVERLADKLEREAIHIAIFGRVGTGKSSLGNALLGRDAFSTSPLHGETRESSGQAWHTAGSGAVELIDTPGIDELDGAARAELAEAVAARADVLLFVCEGDLTDVEFRALEQLAARPRQILLVLNKADRYTAEEQETLLERLEARSAPLIGPGRCVAASADPRPETVVRIDANGRETESRRPREPDVHELRERLWELLEREGKTLAALNAALFASDLDRQVAERVVAARRELADALIRRYCLAKGLAVAANPVPVMDLLAAAGIDVALVLHLGQLYGHRLSRREASRLLLNIAAQLLALMGAYWGVNLVSSALKGMSAGMTTVVTGAAQGALAWYATYVTGKAAETWFARGKDWGPDGPRATVRAILESLDRDSLLLDARQDILRVMNQPRDPETPR